MTRRDSFHRDGGYLLIKYKTIKHILVTTCVKIRVAAGKYSESEKDNLRKETQLRRPPRVQGPHVVS
jgi:hypothetical protein